MVVVFEILENDDKELYQKSIDAEKEQQKREQAENLGLPGLAPPVVDSNFYNEKDRYVKFMLDMTKVKYFRQQTYYFNKETKIGVAAIMEDQLLVQPINTTFQNFMALYKEANPSKKIIDVTDA